MDLRIPSTPPAPARSPPLPPALDFLWEFENEAEVRKWEIMPAYYSLLHELHFRMYKGLSIDDSEKPMGYSILGGFEYDVVTWTGNSATRYRVSFSNMTQKNLTTNSIKRLRRLGPTYSF